MLNIALPSSGPLYQSTIDFFNSAGIPIKRSSLRAYSGTTTFDKNIKIIFQRQSDVPKSISNKIADIGVLGLDRYLENIQNNKTKNYWVLKNYFIDIIMKTLLLSKILNI